jgi:excinuclease ABC subunit A
MVDRVMALPEGTRAYLLAPGGARPQGRIPQGTGRVAEGGLHPRAHRRRDLAIEDAPALDKKFKHDIEVVVDRLAVREGIETRLADSSSRR